MEGASLSGCSQVIVQAGASDSGRLLAAETIFTSGGKLADAQSYCADVRQRARKAGPGAGRRLLAHALHWAKQAGCEFVELASALDRAEAHTFYRRLGFDPSSLRLRKSSGR